MMRTTSIHALMLVSALALAACGGGGDNKAAGNGAAPAANSAASPAAEEDADAGEEAAPAAGAAQDFSLVNNTGRTLVTLNVSPNDSDQWGPDILGVEMMENGQSGDVSFTRGQDQCLWDIRGTFSDGETGDWRGVNLCETTTITLTPA